DDHDNPGSLTHAHFLEPAHAEPHHEDEIEAGDSHHSARWIDFFTLQIPSAAIVLAIDFSEGIAVPLLEESESIILYSEPRAHSPPGRRRSVPRSPPAI
ncbi:MAG TPA: hypothetical protein VFR05_07570, partial [Terriglobia bacterium]|nr:hypothetical protein [Terriglobia bacterium]